MLNKEKTIKMNITLERIADALEEQNKLKEKELEFLQYQSEIMFKEYELNFQKYQAMREDLNV